MQQMQRRVRPTIQGHGMEINEKDLEHEADLMGANALKMQHKNHNISAAVLQGNEKDPDTNGTRIVTWHDLTPVTVDF